MAYKKRNDASQIIDRTLQVLTPTVRDQFLAWCRSGPTYTQMQIELNKIVQENIGRYEGKELGKQYGLNIGQYLFKVWYEREFPSSDTVRSFNEALSAYQGVDHRLIPDQLIHDALSLINVAQATLTKSDSEGLTPLDKVPPQDMMRALPGYIRELRSLLAQKDRYQEFVNQHDLRMQAASRVVSELLGTFKDQANEEEIKLACIDALEAVEQWSLSGQA